MKELNEKDFNILHRKVRYLLDHGYLVGYNEGDIRVGENEGWKHKIAKLIIVGLLKKGVYPLEIEHILGLAYSRTDVKDIDAFEVRLLDEVDVLENLSKYELPRIMGGGRIHILGAPRVKLKSWQTPKIYTEAKFSDKLEGDILAITIDGAYVIEIIDSEEEESLKRKRRIYKNMGMDKGIKINFVEVRV